MLECRHDNNCSLITVRTVAWLTSAAPPGPPCITGLIVAAAGSNSVMRNFILTILTHASMQGAYRQYMGRGKLTGPVTLVLYEDPPDKVPKLHIKSSKFMAWIGSDQLSRPTYLNCEFL